MNKNYRIVVNDVSHDLKTCMFFKKKKKKTAHDAMKYGLQEWSGR